MRFRWILTSLLALTLLGCAPKPLQVHEAGPHLDLNADAAQIEAFMSENRELTSSPQTLKASNEVADALTVGTRLFRWLENINAKLPADQKLSFSSSNSRRGISIEEPAVYNAKSIRAELKMALEQTSGEIVRVVTGQESVPTELPAIELEQFLSEGRRLTSVYDLATRWVLMANYKELLITRQQNDVRGYHYLSTLPDVETKLKGFAKLDTLQQIQIRRALVQLCMNDNEWEDADHKSCVEKITKAEAKGKLLNAYKDSRNAGKKNYESFFTLDQSLVRNDLKWSKKSGMETLRFPFLTPQNIDVATYLKSNVEDEYRSSHFRIEIEFVPNKKKGLSYLEYKPGAVPRAEFGKITMDSLTPITEDVSQSTIRHEFGHLLGFKDCYVEFFDEELDAIVNYQLDTTDIMCSSVGHFKESHYDRLKDQYGR